VKVERGPGKSKPPAAREIRPLRGKSAGYAGNPNDKIRMKNEIPMTE